MDTHDKSDKTLSRRSFIRAMNVVGGTLVATELGLAGCGAEAEGAEGLASSGAAPSGAGPTSVQNAGAAGAAATATPASATTTANASSASATPTLPAGSAASASNPNAAPASSVPAAGQGPAAMADASPGAAADGSGSPATSPATATAPQSGAQTTMDTMAANNGKAKVYIIKTSDRADGIAQALTMFGGLGFAAGRDVIIKPNFNSTYEFPATTHDDTIRTIVSQLRAVNAGNIILGESAGATTFTQQPTETVVNAKGTMALVADLAIDFVSFDTPDVEWDTFQFDGMTWEGGLAIPKLMRSDRVKILLPCCKTHTLADYTFSMKLAAGLPQRSRRGLVSDMHTSLQEKVVDINKGFTPDLIVMDALQCFIDGGPDSGTARSPGLIVVANDRVALDAVGVAILKSAGSTSDPIRGKIFETRQIKRAVEIGLGIKTPDDIELVGNDDATLAQLRSILDMG